MVEPTEHSPGVLARRSETPQLTRNVSVKTAMDEVLKLYNAGNFDTAAKVCAQIVRAQPRLAPVHNLMGMIFNAMGKSKEAAKSLQRAVNLDPRNAQYLSNLGVILGQLGELSTALAVLTQAVNIAPKLSEAHNNLGLVRFGRREYVSAVECHQRAIVYNQHYPEAHNNLGNALRALGRIKEALEHYRKALLLCGNYADAYNNLGLALRETDQIAQAEHCYRKAIQIRPTNLDPYYNLAVLLDENGRQTDALRILDECRSINPKFTPGLVQVARTQMHMHRLSQAEEACRLALNEEPHSPEALCVLGQIYYETNRYDAALKCYQRALKLSPDLIEANIHLGVCLKSMGRFEEAASRFRRVIELEPRAYETYFYLADLVRFTESDPLLQKMESILDEADDSSSPRLLPVHYALGIAYEDLGYHEKAFARFKTGAAIKRSRLDYNETETLSSFDQVREIYDQSYFERRPFAGNPTDIPVFIVGMPRAGSTLIEQIIASHPEAIGAGEIMDFSLQLHTLQDQFQTLPRYPFIVSEMEDAHYKYLAEGYLSKLRGYGPNARRITDKMLANYKFLGLIHVLFPYAKIIHAKRNPMDTCTSAFTKPFKNNMPYNFDLAELGRYWRKQDELMTHWLGVLPADAIKSVSYEDVVEDLPRMAREIIGFLGLPWNDNCLNFHQSSRPVKTASLVQVRRPVYGSSLQRWRLYESELQPLLHALGLGAADQPVE